MDDDQDISNQSHYDDVSNYYANIPPTNDGMLNGYSSISDLDIQTSETFLQSLFRKKKYGPGCGRVLDVGSGIGRISEHLLSKYFDKIDLLEQSYTFIEKAKENLEKLNKLERCYNVGIQNFSPPNDIKYDIIWIQWVLMFILDDDVIKFIQTCKQILSKNGVIVIKDNVASGIKNEYDDEDSSVVRSLSQYCLLFSRAKLKCLKSEKVVGLPKSLFKVYMFALKPNVDNREDTA